MYIQVVEPQMYIQVVEPQMYIQVVEPQICQGDNNCDDSSLYERIELALFLLNK